MEIKTFETEYIYLSPGIQHFVEARQEIGLTHYAYDWMSLLGFQTPQEIDKVMLTFIETVRKTGLSIPSNVKSVFRCEDARVYHDWKLSDLGLSYLIFNTPQKSDTTRKLQLFILSKYLKYK